MAEKEKEGKGFLHNPSRDEALIGEIRACKKLCYDYNQTSPDCIEERNELLRRIIGKVHGNVLICSPFYCDYGRNVELGANFFSNHNLVLLDGAKITIGDNVFVGPNCCFTTVDHPFDVKSRNEGYEIASPITIGNNVWIGAGVNILPGVTIGDGSVIGAGSVVTRDIPAGVVAVGNPCRVMRKIE